MDKKIKYGTIFMMPLLVWFYFCLPDPLFHVPYSIVLNDRDGKLLGATTANDAQWRFPISDTIPLKFEHALLQFEDAYFYRHPGINPVSMAKALYQNIKAGRTVRGGSTLSMQVVRLARHGKARTYLEKVYESLLALRLEFRYSKKKILAIYTAHAPFGGNVVGLSAASWRYFGRPPHLLSWGESATLAVLPNAPALIFPGKNHELLLKKRNKLLDKLVTEGIISETDAELAKTEPLPGRPKPLPQQAVHALARFKNEKPEGSVIQSTLNARLQRTTSGVVDRYYQLLRQNNIFNAAALVVDTKSGEVIAYVGNTADRQNENENAVDIILSRRSSGSTLKPFLFRNMLEDGFMLPTTLLPDIPTYISGYAPKNFDERFDGAVRADAALARSLNVPAVRQLQEYGVDIFLNELRAMGFLTIDRSADNYGLSLILGGAEVTLWDLVENYRKLALPVLSFHGQVTHPVRMHMEAGSGQIIRESFDKAGSSWLTLEALKVMNRPVEGADWRLFSSSKEIAWKTGTSFGHKDAWAVGVTPEFTVGVWVGNADGEGRPGLTGTSTAAPLMLDIFRKLPGKEWFMAPEADLVNIAVCKQSGYKMSSICPHPITIQAVASGRETGLCPYHKRVHLDMKEEYQVNSNCYPVSQMVTKPWFVLPPVMEWYYTAKDPYYEKVPGLRKDCTTHTAELDIVYPQPNAKLFIPRGFRGKREKLVFEAAYRASRAELFWHLDDQFIATTRDNHQIELQPDVGKHVLTLVTETGEVLHRRFEVVD